MATIARIPPTAEKFNQCGWAAISSVASELSRPLELFVNPRVSRWLTPDEYPTRRIHPAKPQATDSKYAIASSTRPRRTMSSNVLCPNETIDSFLMKRATRCRSG